MPSLQVLGPTARRAILCRTMLDPSAEYHLRELVRLTGLAPRTVHQELEKLVRADLLVERRDGNRRYVRVNERHPLFRPLREIVLKTEGLADVLREALGTEGIQFAFVYGSIAAAEATAGRPEAQTPVSPASRSTPQRCSHRLQSPSSRSQAGAFMGPSLS